ncbi:hypothetical protein AMTRI_Chr03g146980 [Amborella trichopoda]|uniref:Uncharacterized protein n=1 Tax=Amborella trichopoda TaxID=13333 RepID=W1P2V7_AMBTC|nr:SEC12-like protein 1 [Amborella trichopoda]ERN01285.1 hypothetical protein AMTR_s00002p00251590 [Amborella trichopoda]|eukprot:XP_006838716.1 SEC12-like protein 1 [Amborella trichopoda]
MEGKVICASWIRRPGETAVVLGKSGSTPSLQFYSFNSQNSSLSLMAEHICEEGDPLSVTVSGNDLVYSTRHGCVWLELYGRESNVNVIAKDLPSLQGIGLQKCLAFSADGSRFAAGGEDGHLRIFEWPNLRILLDEPNAHKSFRDLDFSLDTEYLASTSTDGSARIWKTNEGVPLTSLTRDSGEKIECCRFSRDGTKPFLFCTVQKAGGKVVTAVWDISTWNRLGHKRLFGKPVSVLSISLDGKYLALGSYDGDICVVEVKKMETCHLIRKVHLGACISTVEFCPSERSVLSISSEWGAVITKLKVPADWKDWQVYLVLLGLFLASAVLFYIFFENSDSFWNFPLGRDQPAKPSIQAIYGEQSADDVW